MMNVALDIASAGALEKAGSSAMNYIQFTSPDRDDYRMQSPSIMPNKIENIMQIVMSSQREMTAPHSENNTVNFQNTFNIVVNSGNAGKDTELKELGRKIGQILSDEIKRYGGIR